MVLRSSVVIMIYFLKRCHLLTIVLSLLSFSQVFVRFWHRDVIFIVFVDFQPPMFCTKFWAQGFRVRIWWDREKQLISGQKFLQGLRTLPTYKDARLKQLQNLLKALGSVAELSTAQFANFLSMLDETLWDHGSMQMLRQQIADKTQENLRESMGRRPLQDPSFARSLWEKLLDGKTSGQDALELLCQHASLLGLRLPSEMTMAMPLTLAYQGQSLAMSGNARFQLYVKQKPQIRRMLAGPIGLWSW